MIKNFRMFLRYLYEIRYSITIYTVCMSIFVIYFKVLDIEVRDIWYPILVSTFIALIYNAIRFYYYLKKHNNIIINENNLDEISKNLPAAINQIEEDYQMLLDKLSEEKNNEILNENLVKNLDVLEEIAYQTSRTAYSLIEKICTSYMEAFSL